jgi:mannosyltransferase OCH1-like enzyme
MIPKIIHYIWLGPNPLGEIGERCLASWRKNLPGWKIQKWNEENSPMDHPFVKAMVARKLFAFASDYIRLEALQHLGGLYMDTDTELVGDPAPFLDYDGLTLGLLSMQNRLSKCSVATNLVAALPGDPILEAIRLRYQNLSRAVMNNTLFTQTIMPLFKQRELPQSPNFEFMEEGRVRLYHPDFFNPIRQEEAGKTVPEKKPRSVAIHYGTGAWFGRQDPVSLWRRAVDLRLDRRFLRPIEQVIKKSAFRKKRGAPALPPVKSIPRVVHYVWLGGRPLSAVGETCVRSWQTHLPGWEIRRWDEKNSPLDHPFVRKMTAERKYAFASDYIRLFALAKEGGLYLDTDLELIGDVQPLLNQACVLAFLSAQNRPSKNSAAMGFFASIPGHPWVLELKAMYDRLDLAIMNTTLTTQSLHRRGLKFIDRESPEKDFWELGDIRIYHSDFFYPPGDPASGFRCTPRTVGIHHAEGSWAGQAAPLSLWQRLIDLRLDRKLLRPIEQIFKRGRS